LEEDVFTLIEKQLITESKASDMPDVMRQMKNGKREIRTGRPGDLAGLLDHRQHFEFDLMEIAGRCVTDHEVRALCQMIPEVGEYIRMTARVKGNGPASAIVASHEHDYTLVKDTSLAIFCF
jgi:hypothetical protein